MIVQVALNMYQIRLKYIYFKMSRILDLALKNLLIFEYQSSIYFNFEIPPIILDIFSHYNSALKYIFLYLSKIYWCYSCSKLSLVINLVYKKVASSGKEDWKLISVHFLNYQRSPE